eukprot:tig00020902_g14973.t1
MTLSVAFCSPSFSFFVTDNPDFVALAHDWAGRAIILPFASSIVLQINITESFLGSSPVATGTLLHRIPITIYGHPWIITTTCSPELEPFFPCPMRFVDVDELYIWVLYDQLSVNATGGVATILRDPAGDVRPEFSLQMTACDKDPLPGSAGAVKVNVSRSDGLVLGTTTMSCSYEADNSSPGSLQLSAAGGELLASMQFTVLDLPAVDNSVLDCPTVPMLAEVPFNCTLTPRRAGYVIYALADNITANATRGDVFIAEAAGTAANAFELTVTAWASPIPGGKSAMTVFAFLRAVGASGSATRIARTTVSVAYIPDGTSNITCSDQFLELRAMTSCMFTPRREGEIVWALPSTISCVGEGALQYVNGTISPANVASKAFSLTVQGVSGTLLTGLSKSVVLARGTAIVFASVLVFGRPDNTSSVSCPPIIWAGDSANCTYVPRMGGAVIWAKLDDVSLYVSGSFKSSVKMSGHATVGTLTVGSTSVPSLDYAGLGTLQLKAAAEGTLLASIQVTVVDLPAADNSVLDCPTVPMLAEVPFNCTLTPRRAGYVIYALADNITANATRGDVFIAEAAGTAANAFALTVTAWASPIPGGKSAMTVFAFLRAAGASGSATRIARAAVSIAYTPDSTSNIACSDQLLELGATTSCIFTPRREGEIVWALPSTISCVGEGALQYVNGTISPSDVASMHMGFSFDVEGAPGSLLTGPSKSAVLARGTAIVFASVLVIGRPDNTSSVTCPPITWAGAFANCTFVPRMGGTVIWARLDDVSLSIGGSIKSFIPMSGHAPIGTFTIGSTAVPSLDYTGPGSLQLSATGGEPLASTQVTVVDIPAADNSVLDCPTVPMLAEQSAPVTVLLDDLTLWTRGSAIEARFEKGVADTAVATVLTSSTPFFEYTGPGEVFVSPAANISNILAAGSIFVIDVPQDESSQLTCNSSRLIGNEVTNCTFRPAYWSMPIFAPSAHLFPVIRGMSGGEAQWIAGETPTVAKEFVLSHTAPGLASGGYSLAVYATKPALGANETESVFPDAATTGLYVTNTEVGRASPSVGPRSGGTKVTLTADALPSDNGERATVSFCDATTIVNVLELTSTEVVFVTPPAPASVPAGSLVWCDATLLLSGRPAGTWQAAFRYNQHARIVVTVDGKEVNTSSPNATRVALPVQQLLLSAEQSYDPDLEVLSGRPQPGQGLAYEWTLLYAPVGAALSNATNATVSISNVTETGRWTVQVVVRDVDSNEPFVSQFDIDFELLPVLVSSVRVNEDYTAFLRRFANVTFKEEVRRGVANSFGVEVNRVSAMLPKPGSVILNVNISANNLAQADSFPLVAASFQPSGVASALGVPASGVAQIDHVILRRMQNVPPLPVLDGSTEVAVNGSTYWTVLDGHLSQDVDGRVVDFTWTLIQDPLCGLTQKHLDTSRPGYLNVSTTVSGICQIEMNVMDRELSLGSSPVLITLYIDVRQNLPPVSPYIKL